MGDGELRLAHAARCMRPSAMGSFRTPDLVRPARPSSRPTTIGLSFCEQLPFVHPTSGQPILHSGTYSGAVSQFVKPPDVGSGE